MPPKAPVKPAKLPTDQVPAMFQRYRTELQNLAQKIGELESEMEEHALVLSTLVPLLKTEPTRICYRQIGGTLVQRTVKDVVPTLETNYSGIKEVLDQLVKTYKGKEEEFGAFQKEYGIQRLLERSLQADRPSYWFSSNSIPQGTVSLNSTRHITAVNPPPATTTLTPQSHDFRHRDAKSPTFDAPVMSRPPMPTLYSVSSSEEDTHPSGSRPERLQSNPSPLGEDQTDSQLHLSARSTFLSRMFGRLKRPLREWSAGDTTEFLREWSDEDTTEFLKTGCQPGSRRTYNPFLSPSVSTLHIKQSLQSKPCLKSTETPVKSKSRWNGVQFMPTVLEDALPLRPSKPSANSPSLDSPHTSRATHRSLLSRFRRHRADEVSSGRDSTSIQSAVHSEAPSSASRSTGRWRRSWQKLKAGMRMRRYADPDPIADQSLPATSYFSLLSQSIGCPTWLQEACSTIRDFTASHVWQAASAVGKVALWTGTCLGQASSKVTSTAVDVTFAGLDLGKNAVGTGYSCAREWYGVKSPTARSKLGQEKLLG